MPASVDYRLPNLPAETVRWWPLAGWAPRAVVFDCDGVLMNTEPCWTRAQATMFARRGLGFRRAHKELLIGHSVTRMAGLMGELLGEPAESISSELDELMTDIVSAGAQPMPGAARFAAAAAAVVPTAVVSGAGRVLLDLVLGRSGFADVFTCTLAGDELPTPGAEAGVYRLACERLGVSGAQALAVEDSLAGLRAARTTGLRTVGMPTLADQSFPSDAVVSSFHDPLLTTWLETWAWPPALSASAGRPR